MKSSAAPGASSSAGHGREVVVLTVLEAFMVDGETAGYQQSYGGLGYDDRRYDDRRYDDRRYDDRRFDDRRYDDRRFDDRRYDDRRYDAHLLPRGSSDRGYLPLDGGYHDRWYGGTYRRCTDSKCWCHKSTHRADKHHWWQCKKKKKALDHASCGPIIDSSIPCTCDDGDWPQPNHRWGGREARPSDLSSRERLELLYLQQKQNDILSEMAAVEYARALANNQATGTQPQQPVARLVQPQFIQPQQIASAPYNLAFGTAPYSATYSVPQVFVPQPQPPFAVPQDTLVRFQ